MTKEGYLKLQEEVKKTSHLKIDKYWCYYEGYGDLTEYQYAKKTTKIEGEYPDLEKCISRS